MLFMPPHLAVPSEIQTLRLKYSTAKRESIGFSVELFQRHALARQHHDDLYHANDASVPPRYRRTLVTSFIEKRYRTPGGDITFHLWDTPGGRMQFAVLVMVKQASPSRNNEGR